MKTVHNYNFNECAYVYKIFCILFQGFLDMNEAASLGVLRELFEEAINIDKFSPDKKAQVKNFLEKNSKQVKSFLFIFYFICINLNNPGDKCDA